MKKNILRITVIAALSMILMSCVVKHECPTKLDANGNKYMDRNACAQNTYLLGFIPLG
ncbi:hypothetical protein [Francisella philomiragia]|uniref:hypothetical protein n=1 Tax=Francisella philomiragia TaxID=28110 RepID=UPI0019074CA7|nr:hypothetical protein [Francisella philomiragia]MBK2094076.1 hypothetical protein [Francisella philomiragia]MBK2256547.1 hypothetical protein [Francisella philomiragia]MBK2269205.1 hypothetical protein [Francisella philomiragia]MBK2270321.1 hypothetical protein [Francisella philomiragia]MBK2274100.1 hypothetical protein [Francisella philomiragia]